MNLLEAVDYFISARRHLSDATKRGYKSRLGMFARALGVERELDSITLADLEGWYGALHDQQTRWADAGTRPPESGALSPHTIDCYYRAVRAFLNWLGKRGVLHENPITLLEHKAPPETPPKWLETRQVEDLLAAAARKGTRDYALVRFALATGVRRGGLYGMRVRDVDLNVPTVVVTEKGNKQRWVFFDDETTAALSAWLDRRPAGSDYVWVTAKGKRLSLGGLRQVLRRVCKEARCDEVGLHRLRHTFARIQAKAGVDIKLLQKQLGHADLETTYRYVKWDTDDQRAAFGVNRLPIAEREVPRLRRVK